MCLRRRGAERSVLPVARPEGVFAVESLPVVTVATGQVAETMAHKITGKNPGQGLAANLATAALVTSASWHGLPVSTTHVSVGALLGIGVTTRQVHWKPVLVVLASWVVTLLCAALLAAGAYWVAVLALPR